MAWPSRGFLKRQRASTLVVRITLHYRHERTGLALNAPPARPLYVPRPLRRSTGWSKLGNIQKPTIRPRQLGQAVNTTSNRQPSRAIQSPSPTCLAKSVREGSSVTLWRTTTRIDNEDPSPTDCLGHGGLSCHQHREVARILGRGWPGQSSTQSSRPSRRATRSHLKRSSPAITGR